MRASRNPFASAVDAYLDAGWSSPVPLGQPGEPARKAPVPKGYTGHEAKVPSARTISRWTETHAANNIGLHLPPGIIGLDVDHYEKEGRRKVGGRTLRALEEELGPLPETWRSSARHASNPSGIRFYRVPPDTEFITKLPGDIEIIQAKHRYAVVWPSMHPDTGSRYEWYAGQAGHDPWEGPLPKPEQLPELPDTWVDSLAVGAVKGLNKAGGLKGEAAIHRWLRERQGDGQCRAMRGTVAVEVRKLTEAGAGGRYDTARDGVMALARLSAEGHPGVLSAIRELRFTYEEAVAGEAHRDPTEWARSVIGAVSALQGSEVPLHGRVCPDRGGVSDRLWPAPGDPYAVACKFVDDHASRDGVALLRFWRGDFWRWIETHWRMVSEGELKAELYSLLADAGYMGAAEQPTELAWKPDKAKLIKVLDALAHHPALFLPETLEPDRIAGGSEIAFTNGVLRIYDDGTRVWCDHSPARFNLTSLPYAYDEDADEPKEWLGFLDSLALDADEVALLQEWFGYVVSGDTAKQKMMLLLGPTRAGKGVITRTLQSLVGRVNCANPSLDDFATNFGLSLCIGKTLISINDARFGGRNSRPVIEKLLNVSGGDAVQIDRKNREPWQGPLPGRVMVVSNELPSLSGEASSALAERFIGPLELHKSFLRHEDEELEARIRGELSGVLAWSLEGYEALLRRDGFTRPARSVRVRRELAESLSPLSAFLEECCETGPRSKDFLTPTDRMYAAYRSWCENNGRYAPVDKIKFSRDVRVSTEGHVFVVRVRSEGGQIRAYAGIRLRPEIESFSA